MKKPVVWQDPCLDDVGREKPGTGHHGRRPRRLIIGVVGALDFAAIFFDIGADGGRGAALVPGTFGDG